MRLRRFFSSTYLSLIWPFLERKIKRGRFLSSLLPSKLPSTIYRAYEGRIILPFTTRREQLVYINIYNWYCIIMNWKKIIVISVNSTIETIYLSHIVIAWICIVITWNFCIFKRTINYDYLETNKRRKKIISDINQIHGTEKNYIFTL